MGVELTNGPGLRARVRRAVEVVTSKRILLACWYVLSSLSSVAIIALAIVLFVVTHKARQEIEAIHADVTSMQEDLSTIRVIYDTIGTRLQQQSRRVPPNPDEGGP